MDEIVMRINEILKLEIDHNMVLDISRCDIITKIIAKNYTWKDITRAFIQILADNTRTPDEYTIIAQVLFSADFSETCDKDTIDKDRLIALINYRLNPFDKPYEDNLAWSLTCDFYNLDYCNSMYNVFRDEKMIHILQEYGLME